jgi:hypothetical protein
MECVSVTAAVAVLFLGIAAGLGIGIPYGKDQGHEECEATHPRKFGNATDAYSRLKREGKIEETNEGGYRFREEDH